MTNQEQFVPRGVCEASPIGRRHTLSFDRDADGRYFCLLGQYGKFIIFDGMCMVDLDPSWANTTHVKVVCSDKDPDPRRSGRIQTVRVFKPREPREKFLYTFGLATKVDVIVASTIFAIRGTIVTYEFFM